MTQMDADTRVRLTAFYQPFNERLFSLSGAQCDWALAES